MERGLPSPAPVHEFLIVVYSQFVARDVFFSSRRRHTRYWRDWSSDVCSSDLIAAASMNAGAAARFLERDPPDLDRVRESLGWLMNDTARASDIIQRIRDLIKKAPPRKDRLDINEAIRDVIELTRGEALKNGVSIETELAASLPFVEGDRVQLQQVVLNLIINAIQAMGTVADG